nr:ribosomal protein small subunit 4 [Cyperus rotundus]
MPALRFKTCRLLLGNVWKRELQKIPRRILRRLRGRAAVRYIIRKRSMRENLKRRTLRLKELDRCRKLSEFLESLFNKKNLTPPKRECFPRRCYLYPFFPKKK